MLFLAWEERHPFAAPAVVLFSPKPEVYAVLRSCREEKGKERKTKSNKTAEVMHVLVLGGDAQGRLGEAIRGLGDRR